MGYAESGQMLRLIDETGELARPLHSFERELLPKMYHHMLRQRVVDELMLKRQRQGKVGFYGPVTGQEATPVGTALALSDDDWVFPALREAGIMLVRGFELTTWLAQVYGNAGDVLKGRQMPSHMSGRSVNQVSWSSCIGPQMLHAVGAAWAAKLKGHKKVTVGFMGDGATSQPDFHSAMNFAAVFKVPCVLICQNNHWSISVPTEKQTASKSIAIKGVAYGVPSARVDGNDVLAVYEVVKEAAERARAGEGPSFIEAVTYRMGPHSSSDDPTRYRSREEVAMWEKRDPLLRVQRVLQSEGLLSPDGRDRLQVELEKEVREAIRKVEALGKPARESLLEDVYAKAPWHLREQAEQLAIAPIAQDH